MGEKLSTRRVRGLSASGMRSWGIFFLFAGVAGRSIIQNTLLGIGTITSDELLTAMQADSSVMVLATIALVCQIMETCAVPLFAFLLVEDFQHSDNRLNYMKWVAILALVSEVPYNLTTNGTLIDLGSRNPAFSMLLCLVMLWFFEHGTGKSVKAIASKVLGFVGAFLWCVMLGIEHGIAMVILTTVLWAFRNKTNVRSLFAFSACMLCSMFNIYYVASSMSFIFVHMYNGEEGEDNRRLTYIAYPAMMLIVGLGVKFIG